VRDPELAKPLLRREPTRLLDQRDQLLDDAPWEREVAALVLQGHSTKAIASALVISPWTAQDHLKAIYEKVGVSSRSELVSLVPAAVPA
jgi:DNA-binding CsgD family transcriptional regulator